MESRRRHTDRRGFSFTEVLFAVMILGIGFIMVAAIFPVAIQQSRTSAEETTAAAVTRGAANFLEKVANNMTMPPTGVENVVVCGDFDGMPGFLQNDQMTLSGAIKGSGTVASDSRYAWVPFYRRAGDPAQPSTWSPFAQVIMIPVLARNASQFFASPSVVHDGTGLPVIGGSIYDGLNGAPDTIVFDDHFDVPSEGAFVILADARPSKKGGPADAVAPHLHGRIYRLGNRVPPANPEDLPVAWELMPGFDFDPIRIDANGLPMDGAPPNPQDGKETVVHGNTSEPYLLHKKFFVVGRGVDPNVQGKVTKFDGSAQDISAYTTFVNVK